MQKIIFNRIVYHSTQEIKKNKEYVRAKEEREKPTSEMLPKWSNPIQKHSKTSDKEKGERMEG